jgi:FMN phosphatase YigB (HAD superfamily)
LRNFYNISPDLYRDTITVLEELRRCNKTIGLHSHAQKSWTKIKAEDLGEKLGERVPYFTTDLSKKKDKEQWIKSCEIIDTPIENILVIGDSFSSDIIPSIEAGCKHLIWIDKYNNGLPKDFVVSKDVELITVNDIGYILHL